MKPSALEALKSVSDLTKYSAPEPAAMIVCHPRKNGKTTLQHAAEIHHGQFTPPPPQRERVMTVKNAFAMMADIVQFMLENGPRSLNRLVHHVTNGRSINIADVDPNDIERLHSSIQNGTRNNNRHW